MSDIIAEVADHLTVAIIDGINMKNSAAIQSNNLSNYKPIDVKNIVDLYVSIYEGIESELKE